MLNITSTVQHALDVGTKEIIATTLVELNDLWERLDEFPLSYGVTEQDLLNRDNTMDEVSQYINILSNIK